MDLARTPWVDRLFRQFLERVRAVAPSPEQLPIITDKKPLRVAEFGCGHYGCALPTSDPAIVIKVTTDPTEAAFAVIAMAQSEHPEGVVSYHAAYATDFKLRGKQAFVLWRQVAFRVGYNEVFEAGRDGYENEKLRDFVKDLTQYRGLASQVRDQVLRAKNRWAFLEEVKREEGSVDDVVEGLHEAGRIENLGGPLRTAASLAVLGMIEEEMQQSAGADLVGAALEYYRSRGLLLADVHANNVGHRFERDSALSGIIIVDPGHAIALEKRWQAVEIPDLP